MNERMMMSYTARKAALDQEALKADPVLACDPRRTTNAKLIVDARRLGWIGDLVFDATYGEGAFWRLWQPRILVTNDLHRPAEHRHDYLKPWPESWGSPQCETVVFDPPYMLNGKPSLYGERYGLAERVPVPQRLAEIEAGAVNCASLVAPDGTLLVKCMDQVSLFQVHRQTDLVIRAVEALPGFKLLGWLELTEKSPRPQAKQVTPRFNCSTLLAFHRAPVGKRRTKAA
jgi:hypothetical protein